MRKYPAILIILGLALWFPPTRGLILYILPLGSGVDDLIFILALGAGLSLYALGKASTLPDREKRRWTFFVVLVSVLAIAGIILTMF